MFKEITYRDPQPHHSQVFQWSESHFIAPNFYKLVAQVEASAGASEAAVDIVAHGAVAVVATTCTLCSWPSPSVSVCTPAQHKCTQLHMLPVCTPTTCSCTQWRASGVANRKLQQMTSEIHMEKSCDGSCKCWRFTQNWLTGWVCGSIGSTYSGKCSELKSRQERTCAELSCAWHGQPG